MKILAILQTSFPNHYKNFDETMLKLAVQMWHKAFEDTDFEVVFGAVSKYILKNKFPPTVADIREEVIFMTNPKAMKSGEEAWEEVISAIRRFGYYRMSDGLKTLDNPTQRAVKTIGWANICKSENIGIERSNFYKLYEALNKGVKEQALLPAKLYEAIQSMTQQAQLGEAAKNENATTEVQEM